MANTRSAAKANRKAVSRWERNRRVERAAMAEYRRFFDLQNHGASYSELARASRNCASVFDRAVNKGVFPKNKANRLKSRFAHVLACYGEVCNRRDTVVLRDAPLGSPLELARNKQECEGMIGLMLPGFRIECSSKVLPSVSAKEFEVEFFIKVLPLDESLTRLWRRAAKERSMQFVADLSGLPESTTSEVVKICADGSRAAADIDQMEFAYVAGQKSSPLEIEGIFRFPRCPEWQDESVHLATLMIHHESGFLKGGIDITCQLPLTNSV